MPRRTGDLQNIMIDLVNSCERSMGHNAAVKGVRNLCRYFGGGMYYIPAKKRECRTLTEMFIVLRDSVGERGANAIIGKMMALFGHQQIYIPLEVGTFEETIALEIYQRGFTENVPMRVMVRDYNISFNKVYKLWHKGRSIKLREEKRK